MTCLDSKIEIGGAITASTLYTSITSGAANTKGSYAELLASSAVDAHSIILYVAESASTSIESFLIDLAVGAAASEQIIIPNFQYNQRSLYGEKVVSFIRLPFPIPAATRISARCQSATASAVVRMAVMVVSGSNDEIIGKVYDYGTLTASSAGTSINAGASANTKGSWTELVASSAELKGLFVTIGPIAGGAQDAGFFLDIGIGAAASEQVIIPNLHLWVETDGSLISQGVWPIFWVPVPAASRIAARVQCTTADATYRIVRVAAYGVA